MWEYEGFVYACVRLEKDLGKKREKRGTYLVSFLFEWCMMIMKSVLAGDVR